MTDADVIEVQRRGSLRYGVRWIEAMGTVRTILKASGVDLSLQESVEGRAYYLGLQCSLALALCRASRLDVINTACAIIELGDERLLASDGPAGGQPPDISLEEWRALYKLLDRGRRDVLVPSP